MVSMEYEENAKRADYNRPLKCIEVVAGESSVVLNNGAINCTEKRALVWLDYDGMLDASVVADLRTVCGSVQVGSFVIATVNAIRRFYLTSDETGNLNLEKSLRKTLGVMVPDKLPESLDTRRGFSPVIAAMMLSYCEHTVRKASGNERFFLPIFNFSYADGASMVTIGGAVCDGPFCKAVRETGIFDEAYVSGEQQFAIDLPVLTRRERITLNRLLPTRPHLVAADAEANLSFTLSQNQCRAYSDFYRFYPNYAELFD